MAPKAASKAAPAKTVAVKAAPAPVDNRTLSAKDTVLFKSVLTLYEQHAWKKGIKSADLILKNNPEHGETLAMKGLFLTHVDKSAEGYELVKRGVRNDLRSHIVWHVYGLMHRADRNYEEALKCYVQANRIEKDSANILTDLAILSVHLRQFGSYVLSRQSILRTQPRLRRNWISLAVAQHLDGQHYEADRTLSNYEASVQDVPLGEYEHSEVLMYHAMVLEEWGKFERCLEYLGENSRAIVDRSGYATQRARLLLKLGRTEPAEWAWSMLVEENPDSYEYIKSCIAARGADFDSTTVEGKAAAVKALDALSVSHPRSLAIRRLALDISSGDEFRTKASRYLIDALSKGVPSIFADIKALYGDSEKRTIIGELAKGYRQSLETNGKFGMPVEGESEDSIEASSAYLWTLYFLAQHQSALGAASQPQALALIALAEAHTPSLPELSMMKARILKRGGDPLGAMESMEAARALDGQDRFLNSKGAKYLLRADKVKEAEACVGLFTKKEAPSPLEDLVDMQCLWLLHEEGDSLVRQRKFALALKRYHQIFAIFNEIEDDQFDFHSYCLRKSTLRAYVDLLRYSDGLRSHPRYYGAAKGAIEIYLRIHDDPTSVASLPLTPEEMEALKETKKAENKAKKAKEAERALEKAKKPPKKGDDEDNTPTVVVDADPLGEVLLATKDPLGEAIKWLKPLEKCAPKNEGVWELSYEVNLRRGKYLLALKALRTLHSLAPNSTALHLCILRFLLLLPTFTEVVAPVLMAIHDALVKIYDGSEPAVFNTSILQKGLAAAGVLAHAKGLALLQGQQGTAEVESALFALIENDSETELETTLASLALLQSIKSTKIDEFKALANAKLPLACAFQRLPFTSTNSVPESEKEIMQD